MKHVKSGKIYNPVTGKYYTVMKAITEKGDKPIRGLWSKIRYPKNEP